MVPVRRHARNWRTYLACGGLVLVALIWSPASADQAGQHNGKAPTQESAQQPPETAVASDKPARTNIYTYSCKHPETADQENLCIERRAAKAAQQQATWSKFTFIIGCAGTAAVIATLVFTAQAARAAQDAARAAKDSVDVTWKSSAVVNRAYIGVIGCDIIPVRDVTTKKIFAFNIVVSLKNTGATPTKKVTGASGYAALDAEPGRTFNYVAPHGGNFWHEIAPGEIRPFERLSRPVSEWKEITSKEKKCCVWGWVEYYDAFQQKIRHRTEFCVRVTAEGDIFSNFTPTASPIGPHNGTDEDCLYPPQTT